MENIEKYISNHRMEFDDNQLPQGHQDRFLAKLDSVLSSQEQDNLVIKPGKSTINRSKLIIRFAMPAAALLILSIGALWALRSNNDSYEVYRNYMDKVTVLTNEIYSMSGYIDDSQTIGLENDLRVITSENVMLQDQLPDELSRAQRDEILKSYYDDRIEGVEKIRDYIKNSINK